MAEKKETNIDNVISNILKKFGNGSAMKFGDTPEKVDAISTGCISLDRAIGIGGIPKGRVVEIYGPESAGKSTICLHLVAEAQRAGGLVAYLDTEHALDPKYSQALGVDLSNLIISQPDCAEDTLNILQELIKSGDVSLIIIDSVAALVPRAELDGESGDAVIGVAARLMAQALRKATGLLSETNTTVIFVNQLRSKIGVMFGSSETTTGGNALKYYASVRLDIRRIGKVQDGDKLIGNRTKVKVVKNKVGPPFQECEFDIIYGEGISKEGDLLDLAVTLKVVEKSGSWYSFEDERLGQGREKIKQHLKENKDLYEKIRERII